MNQNDDFELMSRALTMLGQMAEDFEEHQAIGTLRSLLEEAERRASREDEFQKYYAIYVEGRKDDDDQVGGLLAVIDAVRAETRDEGPWATLKDVPDHIDVVYDNDGDAVQRRYGQWRWTNYPDFTSEAEGETLGPYTKEEK